MNTCIMCDKEAASYPGYVTDGIITVCNSCAAANSLARIVTRIENMGFDSNIKSVFSEPIVVELGLVNQTDEHVELDKSVLDAKPGLVDQTNECAERGEPDNTV